MYGVAVIPFVVLCVIPLVDALDEVVAFAPAVAPSYAGNA